MDPPCFECWRIQAVCVRSDVRSSSHSITETEILKVYEHKAQAAACKWSGLSPGVAVMFEDTLQGTLTSEAMAKLATVELEPVELEPGFAAPESPLSWAACCIDRPSTPITDYRNCRSPYCCANKVCPSRQFDSSHKHDDLGVQHQSFSTNGAKRYSPSASSNTLPVHFEFILVGDTSVSPRACHWSPCFNPGHPPKLSLCRIPSPKCNLPLRSVDPSQTTRVLTRKALNDAFLDGCARKLLCLAESISHHRLRRQLNLFERRLQVTVFAPQI